MGLVVSATASCSDIFFSRRRSSSPPPPAAASTPPPTYTIPEPALVRVFRHFDADGDGRISADEMRELCGCTAVEADEMVAVADRDGDGFISLEELEALFEDGDRSDTLRAAFAEYDENGDGVITAEELRRALWRLGIVGGGDDGRAVRRDDRGGGHRRRRGGLLRRVQGHDGHGGGVMNHTRPALCTTRVRVRLILFVDMISP